MSTHYPVDQPLITFNSDYVEEPGYDGDPAITISHRVSRSHHIKDNADPAYMYTGYFRVINKLPVALSDVVVYLGLDEVPDSAVCDVNFVRIAGDSASGNNGHVRIGTLGQNGTSSEYSYTYSIVRARPFGSLTPFEVKLSFWPTFNVNYQGESEFVSRTQVEVVGA